MGKITWLSFSEEKLSGCGASSFSFFSFANDFEESREKADADMDDATPSVPIFRKLRRSRVFEGGCSAVCWVSGDMGN